MTVGGEPIAAELPSGVRTGGIYTFGAGDVDGYNDGDGNDYKYQFQEQMASCWDLELASEGLSLMGRGKMGTKLRFFHCNCHCHCVCHCHCH